MSSSLCSEAAVSVAETLLSESSSALAAEAPAAAVHEDLAFSLDNLSLLVEDIKEGFSATMQQLVKIEGQDGELRSRLDTAELETKQKIDALQAVVQQMRDQFNSVLARVESLELHHRRLEGQMNQLDRAAQAERTKLQEAEAAATGAAVGVCCHHSVYDVGATCQTPMTPYSCATPLSPDSGRPGTCTPSCCYHGNEFQNGEHTARLDAGIGGHVSVKPAAVATAAASANQAPPAKLACHHGVAVGSCEAIAEKSLHMSRALVDGFGHVDSSGEDCELDSLVAESPAEQLTASSPRSGKQPQQIKQQHGNGRCRSPRAGEEAPAGLPPVRQVAPHEKTLHRDRRRRVCQEIVETERKYCSCLWTIIDLIAESLKSATFLNMKDLCLIFPKCLPRLYELHSTFLGLLEDRLRAEDTSSTGAAFLESAMPSPKSATFSAVVLDFLEANNGELFNLYRDYANDFGTAVQTIRKYQQHSARFRKLQHSLQHHPSCEGLDLTAFLLTPVQRMPRYLLLMRQLSVHTTAGHLDEASLNCVLERLHCLLDELNYSIQTALRQAAEQQQQQQRWKRSRSLPRPAEAGALASASLTAAASEADSLLSGSSGRVKCGGHFLAGSSSQSSSRRAAAFAATAASARCRSMPPPLQQQSQQLLLQRRTQTPTRTESPKMGPRSRLISRQLRTADRCMSTGDILRASPVPSVASTASGNASPLIVSEERVQERLVQLGTTPKSTLKESFRRMFQSRRKSSLAKLETPPDNGRTFEDENGDPCTDV